MKQSLFIAAVLTLLAQPHARAESTNTVYCHEVPVTRVASTVVVRFHSSVCEPGLKLQLARTEHAFPLMGNASYAVDYWQGSYQRAAALQDTYRTDLYDSCSGGFLRTEFVPGPVYEGQAQFTIDNPNLRDDVRQSFALVPMTDEEAKAALDHAQSECEQASN